MRAGGATGPGEDTVTNTGFYVTVIDGTRSGRMLGPYDTLAEAEANVTRARVKAEEVDAFAHFYAFGTAKVTSERPLPPGLFNNLIGLTAPVPA